jgi:hypothetical protein
MNRIAAAPTDSRKAALTENERLNFALVVTTGYY